MDAILAALILAVSLSTLMLLWWLLRPLTQLEHRPRPATGAGIGESDRPHRPEAQRLRPAPGHLLDRQAPLEIRHLVEFMRRELIRFDQRRDEAVVLLACERGVEVVVAVPLAIAGERVDPGLVQRFPAYDRCDRIVEGEGNRRPRLCGTRGRGVGRRVAPARPTTSRRVGRARGAR